MLSDRILPRARGTGYPNRDEPEHLDYQQYIEELADQEERAEEEEARRRLEESEAQRLYEQAEAEEAASHPPTLTVTTAEPPLAGDLSISPFIAAPGSSPAFTEPREPPQEGSGSSGPTLPSVENEPEPGQEGQEQPALEAQFEYTLDFQQEEENPLEPEEQPPFLSPLQALLQFTPAAPIPPQLPAPQIVPPIAMAQQPAVVTTKLRGEPPTVFTGEREKAETFKQEFTVQRYLNPNNEIMRTPYYRVMQHLSLIKGPKVDDWKEEQIADLVEKTTRTNNPIGFDKDVLWTEYETAFDSAFTDTTKKQKAQAAIKHLRMQDQDLDTYISTFKHLAKDAGYDLTMLGTADLFALGLRRNLFDAIMYRNTQPETFEEWVAAAKSELIKRAKRYAMQESAYQAQSYHKKPYKAANGRPRYIHPNDRTVPMDVDPPVHTFVQRVYTEQDKRRYMQEGRCFNCGKQSHKARDCPDKKKQFTRSGPYCHTRMLWQPLCRTFYTPYATLQYTQLPT